MSSSSAGHRRNGHGHTLRLKISLAYPVLGYAYHRFWTHRNIEGLLARFLPVLHCSVRATVPLLLDAATQARILSPSDPVARQLVGYFERHAEEERDHEQWLLDDIAAFGLRKSEVLAMVPPAEVASLIGAQYYWIRHCHPLALLGSFAVREGDPPLKPTLESVLARTKVPRQAFRSHFKHAELDPVHRRDLDDLLDSLPLSPKHEELLGLSALHTIDQMARILDRLLEEGSQHSKRSQRRPPPASV